MDERNCFEDDIEVQHITPSPDELSTIQSNLPCLYDGCNKTFTTPATMRFHLEKVRHLGSFHVMC